MIIPNIKWVTYKYDKSPEVYLGFMRIYNPDGSSRPLLSVCGDRLSRDSWSETCSWVGTNIVLDGAPVQGWKPILVGEDYE
jgi:hypothetical protein